ncbi:PIN domain-containing protein [Candidatus Woesearchaeota archaeon]|nr:PIN domain-containing protein [Candidatus Woesearchaeota archaeon]
MTQGQDGKPLPLRLRVVPDTSVIVEGFLSRKIEKKEIMPEEVIIHEAVMAELESQANKNRETGYTGLEEIKRIRELGEGAAKDGQEKGRNFKVTFKGNRPTDFEIKYAKAGEIDSLIRKLAIDEKATLITADKVQSLVAESKGLSVILYELEAEEVPFCLEQYFDKETARIHIRAGHPVMVMRGSPEAWTFKKISGDNDAHGILDKDAVRDLAKQAMDEANARADSSVLTDKRGSAFLQVGDYKVLVTRPPISSSYEIVCERQLKDLGLDDYPLDLKSLEKIDYSNGILLIGSPDSGKTTFATALAKHFLSMRKNVSTIDLTGTSLKEDSMLSQYALNLASPSDLYDIFLQTKPHWVLFDDMKSLEDIRLFLDLRSASVSTVGVMNASDPGIALQKVLLRNDLAIIPRMIDLLILMHEGRIDKMFSLKMQMKIPKGLKISEPARAVLLLVNVDDHRTEFEFYKSGDELVVTQL